MKTDLNLLRNFSETKLPSALLTNKTSLIAKCNFSTRANNECTKPYFLPILRTVFQKLSEIMLYKKSSCKLMCNNEWCSINLKMFPLYYNDKTSDKTLNLNTNELFIIWFLSNKQFKQYNMSMSVTNTNHCEVTQNEEDICSKIKNIKDNTRQSNVSVHNFIPKTHNLHLYDCKWNSDNSFESNTFFSFVNIFQENNSKLNSPELKQKKKRKKQKHNLKNQTNQHCTDKSKIEYKQKKKRKKNKKRQRCYDRDSKEQSKYNYDNDKRRDSLDSFFDSKGLLPTAYSTLTPSIAQKRVRHFSECSNDSLEICFMDEGETELLNFDIRSYNQFTTSESNSDSGLLDEKKVIDYNELLFLLHILNLKYMTNKK